MHPEMARKLEKKIDKQNENCPEYIIKRGIKNLHDEVQKVIDKEIA